MPYKDLDKRKAASKASSDRWQKKYPELAAKKAREWRANNPKYMLVAAAKRRAKQNEIEFNLTIETCPDIPEVCPVLGVKLEARNDGVKGPKESSPTLDRIDPTKGYVINNVKVISHRANRLKSDMSLDELRLIMEYMNNEMLNG